MCEKKKIYEGKQAKQLLLIPTIYFFASIADL